MKLESPLRFVAHRGAPDPGLIENSLEAISRAAILPQFDSIEFDIHRTRTDTDGSQNLIVIHDDTLDRLYELRKVKPNDRNKQNVNISNLTLSQIKFENLQIPMLHEAIQAAGKAEIRIEVKSVHAVEATVAILKQLFRNMPGLKNRIILSSFDYDALQKLYDSKLGVRLVLNYRFKSIPRPISGFLREIDSDGIAINKWLAILLLPYLKRTGLPQRAVYTVNSAKFARLLKSLGATHIFTDSTKLPTQLS